MTDTLATPPPSKPKFRPPVGLPAREESRVGSAVASLTFHLLILLLIAGPLFVRQVLDPTMGGAGGAGPAGGGGGGRGGSGGERLQFVQIAPAPKPAAVPVPAVVQPPKPVVTPPTPTPPVPQAPAPTAEQPKDASQVTGTGGGSGHDGTNGSGPGSGGGVGSGIGTGKGSGTGPGTGGGVGTIYPPTVTNLAILPIPVPGKVRPYKLIAYFDVDERGNSTLISFTPSKDDGYNKKIRAMLAEVRFRPAVRGDGTPVRDTAFITAEAP